ncbi:winged helix-turn-helix domain-containing protein [Amnibacterium flavum]|uniref:Transcriptional regulator n=1 Tax=Amnibacterium flavum TaxID=2173173 RepID=A0A2V1HV37_9MICO|nr:winged helix-turn-helix domain-containing protein [Amnibacterium flavum]PVZ95582.1 transcriptional regulator [Amnibacterium flavum]
MSLLQLDLATTTRRPTLADRQVDRPVAPLRPVTTADAPAKLHAVPEGTEARGFALYVGVDEAKAAAAGIDLPTLVRALRALTAELVPSAETHAAVALARARSGGRDVEVVRLALQEPAALAGRRGAEEEVLAGSAEGVVIDISRKHVTLGGEVAPLTFKEFELLQYLVLREGRTIDRSEIISALWGAGDEEAPNSRTIDVHVRRLRSKLGSYQAIVRTVRGAGYRFDRHADVIVRHSHGAPSPDRF